MQQENQQITPKKHLLATPTKPLLYSKGNQSTTIQSPPREFSTPHNPWKTPKSLLKSAHYTPEMQVSPYSDRYIPFRSDDVSRNLFQKQIQPFELEEDKLYQELLSENLLQIDENKPTSILSFHKQKLDIGMKVKQELPKQRKIDSQPYKVLDAPGMDDDFYKDTLHWGKNNLIAVGLAQSVYLYNVENQKISELGRTPMNEENQAYYTSLQWNPNGSLLAMGCYDGALSFWDYQKQNFVNKVQISNKRISSISWANSNVLAYGCKDKNVIIGDVRVPHFQVACLSGHYQEVCGVTFDGNETQLASGGNDNRVIVWQMRGGAGNYSSWEIKSHKAAVRALAWNPHSSGILATGGGNNDKTIKLHSVLTNTQLQSVNVDSQVCKLRFSKVVNELVSTHGYEKNLICLWQQPNMKKIHQLEGHTERVLFLTASPDESTILTGSNDETLKFWRVFPSLTSNNSSALFSMCEIR